MRAPALYPTVSNTYTVKLATEPSATVTVGIAGQASTDVSLDKETLTFTVAKWNEAQTVTVTAAEDDDAVDDEVTLTHTASGGDYGSVTASVAVVVTDDDATSRGLLVSPPSLAVAEGVSNTYTVKLATEPSATVTVGIAGQASTDVSLDKETLTFTAAKWNEAQTVTVTAAEDDDAADDEVTLAHTASGGDYADVSEDVVVTVQDDDTVGLVVAPAAVSVSEADDPDTPSAKEHQETYTVALATEPSAEVTVTISGHASSDVSLDKESLTFTAAKWNEAQTVTVTAAEDDDAADDEVTLAHTASGGDYTDVSEDVVVTVQDDDTVGLVVAPAVVSVSEADDPDTPSAKEHQETYTVALATEPSAEVTVTISGHASSDVSLDKESLTFTAAKWNEAQTVTVTAAEDDDAADDEVTLAHTASGGDYTDVSEDVVVTVQDDDEPGLVVAPAAVSVSEADDPDTPSAKEHQETYTVALATEPSAEVTVTISGHASSDVSLDKESLTFTAAKWNEAQTVTVTAAEDDDAGDDEVTLAHTASGGDYGTVTADVEVTVTDDDARGVSVAPANLTLQETDDPVTQNDEEHKAAYAVKLTSEPTDEVTVTITNPLGSPVTLDTTELEFSLSDWNRAQTVTATAVDDNIDNAGDERAATLTHDVSGGDYGEDEDFTVEVTVTDDDDAPDAITLTVDADTGTNAVQSSLAEDGGAKTVRVTATISSATRFDANTDVKIVVGALGDTAAEGTDYGNVADRTITIPAGARSASVDFPITPTDDNVDEGDETISIEGELTGVTFTPTSVTITDDDMAELSIADASAAEGASAAFTVSLSTPSASEVEVTATTSIETGDTASAADYTHKTVVLTFAPGTTTAPFSVALVDDEINELDETFTVTLSNPTGATIAGATATGTITGDANTLIGIAGATAREGGNLSFTLTRTGDATGVSTVTWTTGDDPSSGAKKATAGTDYTAVLTARTVTFAANAATVTITVTSLADALVEGDETFRVNLAGPTNALLANAFATGTITEGTTGYAIADASAEEGDSLSFTVTRSGLTSGASTVRWNTADDTAGANKATASGPQADYTRQATATALAFAANDTAKTITVATTEDTRDEPDETFRVALGNPSAGGALLRGTAIGTIADDDATAVTLAVPDATATEGSATDTARITLTLNRGLVSGESLGIPLAFDGGTAGTDFTLALATPAPAGVTLTGTTVTFTGPATGATAAAAALTVTASADDDSTDATVTVSIPAASTGSPPILAASGLGGGATGSRTGDGEITLADDGDPPTVAIADVPAKINSRAAFTAKFTFSEDVTGFEAGDVDVAGGAKGDFTAVSHTVYTLVVTPAGSANVKVTVKADSATDGANNDGPAAAVSATVVWDATPPTVEIGGLPAAIDSTARLDATFTFSEDVSGFETADVTVTGGVKGTFASTSGTVYTLQVTPNDGADVTVEVRANAATDEAGNTGPTAVVSATAAWTADVTVAETSGGTEVTEAAGAGNRDTYTLVLTAIPRNDVTITVTPAEGLLVDGPDTPTAGKTAETLTFTASNWNSSQTVTVFGVDDAIDQGASHTLTITHAAASDDDRYDEIDIDDVEVTVTDDDDAPDAITLTVDADTGTQAVQTSLAEDGGAKTVRVTATITSATRFGANTDVKIVVGKSGDTAAEGTDYETVADQTLTIPAGMASATADFTLTPRQDVLDEPDETISIDGELTGVTVTGTVVTLTDDDAAPDAITLTVDADTDTQAIQSSLAEDGGAKTVRVTATINGPTRFSEAKAVTVKVGNSGDSAAEGTDYGNVADKTITIPAGDRSASVDFPITPTDDGVAEGDEAISIEGELAGVTFTQTSVTIADDDMAELSIDDVTAAEGGTAAFTISLSTPSAAAVTVTATTSIETGDTASAADYTHKTEVLTFTPGTTTAPFRVSINSDMRNELDETFSVTLSGATGVATIDDGTGTGTITGNAKTLISISIAGATAREGGDLSFPLTRAGDLMATSTVAWTTGDDTTQGARQATAGTDYTAVLTARTVTFAPNAAAATITVTSLADALLDGDETFRVNLATPTGALLGDSFAIGTITDGNTGYSVADARAAEGDSLSFTVTRSGLTSVASSVRWNTADDTAGANKATASGPQADYTRQATATALSFAAGDTAKTITVATREDTNDEPEETFRVALSAPSAGGVLVRSTATGTITDDDATTVTLAVPDAIATEGSATNTARITLTLNRGLVSGESLGIPLAFDGGTVGDDFTLALATPAPAGVTLTGTTVTFTGPATGATATTAAVLLTASADDDTTDATVTVSIPTASTGSPPILAASGLGGGATGSRTGEGEITLADDGDPPTVTISGVPDSIDSRDRFTATFTFSEDVSGFETADVTVTGGAKGTFGSTGASVYTLQVTPNDGADVTVEVRANAATDNGGNTGPTAAVSATAAWTAAVTVAETSGGTEVTEAAGAGNRDAYTLVLTAIPRNDVTITVTAAEGLLVDGPDLPTAGTTAETLTFTVSDWNRAQTVTVIGVDDAIDQDASHTLTITHAAASDDDRYDEIDIDDVEVTVTDDDTVGLVVAPAAVTVAEADDPTTQNIAEHQGTYTVKLATEPTAEVTVTISGQADTDVSVDKETLTFTVAKWNEAQTVTVTAAEDDDAGDDEVTLAHTASGGDYGTVTADVVVTVQDDDTVGLVIAPAAVSVSEGGSQTYTVELATEPSATVTVAISGQAGSDVSLDTTSLEFTAAKWSEAQTVTVTAAEDDDAGDDEVTLAHTASGGDYGTVTADVVVTVQDDDTVGLVIAPAAVSVSEGGSRTYTVELATEPSATVTVAISGQAGSDVSLDKASLTFTAAKWSEAQTVTVTAAQDDDAGDDKVTLAHAASGGDYGTVTADVVVTVQDDDTVGLVIAPAAVSVSEGGSQTYTVELATEPSATVTVAISGHASSDVSLDTTSLEFTVAKWSEAQTVTVTAAQDDDAGDDEVTLAHTASGGDYGTVTADVVVTVQDDDTVGLVIAPAAVSVSEGGSRTYTVELATEPSATVTVAISGQAGSDVSLDKASLEFTVAKWSEAQTVTVTAAQDDDAGDDEVTLAHTASGGDYGTVTADVVVTVQDDDTVGLVIAPAAVSVSEGGSRTYTVELATEPSATVTVAISGQAGSDVSLDKASLTFTAAKWSEAQTVTVTAAQDDDAGDDEVTLAHTASGGDYGSVTADVVVTVDDDDTVGLVVAPAAVSVSEGGSQTYTVELATEPSATVTVAISGHASSDVSLDKASLEFTAAKWNEAQTVTVTAAEDDDAGDDEVTLAHAASGGDYGTVTADVVVTVQDDDTVGLVIAPAAVSVSEGGSASYTVELSTEPSATVTVTISGQAGSDVSLDKASLTFTAAKWSEAQTVTVTAAEDDGAGDDEVTLAHAASGGDYADVSKDVVVTVDDDDTVGLVVAPAAVTVAEGGSASYTVKLSTEPSATVTVTISGHASSDVSLDTTSLEFTAAKWSEAQTVTVTAAQDDDAGDDEVTLAHTASGGDYGTVTADVVVTVQDDDTVGLVIAPAAVSVSEGGSASYTVELSTEPSATVTVTISGHASSDVSLDKASLEFTAAKWSEAQTVTVTAAEDDDAGDDEVTLAHAASGGDYGTVTADVVVTVQDDDTVGLVVAPAAVSVSEGGSRTYTVKLSTEPSATVTVGISGQAGSDVSLDTTSLEFTAAKWSEAQTVTVTAAQDADAGDDEVTLAHTASGGDYGSVTADVVVTVDDDETVGLVVAPAAVTVVEGGSASYTVKLSTEPSATVTVTISGHAGSDVSLDKASLEFTAAKWSEAQTVTVTAAQDDDAGNDDVTLAHTASGGDYGSVTADVVVTVQDDDTVGLVVAPAAVSVSEGGSRTYTVKLSTEPSATVTVGISGQAGSDVSLDKETLTFTAAKWSEAQTVTVTAAQDDDAGDDEVTLAHTASGGDYGTVTADVVVTVQDDDTVGLVIAPAAVSVSEGGSASYTVKLSTEPSATVTVGISGQATTDVSLDKASLTFTAAKWSEAQTVTVTAAEDADAGNDEVTLAHTASGGDYGTVTADVVVTVQDDDTVGLVIAPAAVSVSEGGSQTYTVELSTEPSATVTVGISGHASSDVSLDTTSLEFTAAKWSEAQTVTVTAAQDDDAGDDEVTLAHTASGGDYGTVTADVVVTVQDDDTVGLVIAPAAVSVSEGGSQTYTVKLSTEPSATVTVGISGQAGSDVSLDKETLTFTAAKWSEAQTVTVTAAEDDDAGNDKVTLAHTASGGDYGSVTADVVVTVQDDDTVGLVIAPAAVSVSEGGSASYTVKLSTEPSATVTVGISGQATTDVSLDKASLTFTAAKWSEAQTVTVTASEDDDAGDDKVTLAHAASGGDYGSVTADVVVTVQDDDTVGLVVAPAAVTVAEGGSQTYTVKLSTEPSATVTVAISGHASSDVSPDTTSLEFTVAKWSEAQTVTVTAAQDDDAGDDEVTLAHTASGGDYGTVTADVVVTVDDDETVGLVVAPAAVTVAEGGSASYTVKLSTEPTGTVTVAISGHASSDVSLDKASLTFTAAKWNEAQTVTVTAAEDADAGDDKVTLAHTASGGDYGSVTADVVVTVQDDDTVGLVVAPAALTVAEGASASYTVELSTEPSGTVTVGIAGHAGTDVSVDTTTLTFTVAKWNEAQTVTVTVSEDADAGDDEVTLTHTASGGGYGTVTADVVVTVTDDDEAPTGITLSAAPDRVAENGGAQTVTVTAAVNGATRYTETKTVTVSVGGGTAESPADYAGVANFDITIAGGAGSASGSFTLTPVDDAVDEGDETVGVTGVSGALTITAATITITDNDSAPPALVVKPSALTVAEGGSASYTVELATEPSATVTVGISGHSGTDVSPDATSLTFTAAKWSEAQTVTVTAAQDADAADDEVTLAHTASGGDYGSVTADVVVTVTDDDEAPTGITLSAAPDRVAENGGAQTVTVTAAVNGQTRYAEAQTVTVSVGGGTAESPADYAGVANFDITIAGGAGSGSGSFTLTPVDDAVDEGDETVGVTGVSGALTITAATITITDNDSAPPALVVKPSALTVEEGASATYTVELATEPTGTVTVAISGHASSDVSVDTTSLEFTAAKWSEAQTVTVTAAQDADAGDDEVTLAHAASGGDYAGVTADVVVTVTDDDEAPTGITLSAAPDRVAENGGAQTVTVTAAVNGQTRYAEAQTVTVSVGGGTAESPADYAGVADFDITIAGGAGSASGSFTLTPVDDAVDEEDETIGVTGVSGALTITAATITITDDDTVGLVVRPSSLTVGEGGSASYTVALATEPTGTVTVTIGGTTGTDLRVDDASLEFTASKWNEAQRVTVTAGQDADGANDTATLRHTASGGDYEGVTANVGVTVEDDDEAGLVVTPGSLTVGEGGSASYTVALATEPTGTVTVAIGGTTGTDLSVDDASLEFTASKWNEAQTVRVTAGQDADGANDTATLRHTASGGDYEGMTASVVVTVEDDDEAGLMVRPSSLTVAEGGSASYTVALATEPSGTVTVTIGGTTGTDLSVDETSLEFTPSAWGTAQTVRVTAGQDADGVNDTATLRHTASGGGYGSVRKDLPVTVEDDDEVSTEVHLRLDPTSVSEGAGPAEVTVTAALNAATLPTDVVVEVTVSPDSAGAEDFAAVRPLALTIGAGARSVTAAFTFTPVDDVIDEPDESVAVSGRITAPPESALTVRPAVLRIVDDDETPAISIADAGAVESAGRIVFPVTLAGASARTITVSYRTADGTAEAGADYEAGAGEVSFAPGETERSVTIAVIDDALDEADETFLVQLGEAEHATVADGEATGTITDEDRAPLITIEDASEVESAGGIGFVVTLDAPSGRPISVVCRSADGTATAGDDYVEEVGVLRFEPGETQKTIAMELIDDALDEGDEQFLLNLSEPENVRLAAEVVSAVGTIEDDDTAVTVAWLARFGRTVTQQVLEAVGERTQGESALGSEVSLGGHRVNEGSLAAGEEQEAETEVLTGRSGDYRIMSGREFLAASSFLVAMEPGGVEQAGGVSEEAVEGVRWTVWGRGATMSFEGLDEGGRLSIDGSVLTGLAGVDADVGGWLGGLAVGRSDGNGGYGWAADGDRPARAGDLEAELTSVYPYVRVAVTDWLSVWGVFGYGIGELRQVEEERLEEQTAIGMLLGALGGRGELLSVGGVELAVKADGYLLRMTSESTPVLPTVEADVRRLRLTAEGSGQVRIGSGLVVRPSVEVGVRHDGGEVENGTGVELGGGLSLMDLRIGLALSGTARVLVTHEDRGYREWGAAGSLSFDPGAPGRGLAVQVDSSYGAAAGGAEQLWSQGAADLGGAAVPVGRVAAEVGYGVAQSDWSVRPYAGVELAGDAPEWRVGTRFGLGAHDVTVEGSGTTGSSAASDSSLTIQYSVRW